MTHPAVQDAGVVGLPHDIDGELPLAFVVLRDEMTATAQELADYVKGMKEYRFGINKFNYCILIFICRTSCRKSNR